jgi:Chaperone of endosialidase
MYRPRRPLVLKRDVIRIGTQGTHTRTLIAGINNSPVFGSPVLVNAFGRLGIQTSSARFKRDIRDMDDASGGLMKLRPVTFRYNEDPAGTLQYGLIAEEVARVYPELVTYADDGKPQSVAYQMLPAMLLNEMQKQIRENQ